MTENILLQDCALVTAKISIVHSGGGEKERFYLSITYFGAV